MMYGPTGSGAGPSQQEGDDPFSFAPDMLGSHMSTMALMFYSPWRAAFVVADQAMRETFGDSR